MIARNKIPILLLFMIMATVAIAAGPNRISYQGSLTASGGAAIPDASYKMRFTMFDDPTVGTQLWQETQPGVQVIGGLFSTQLGAFTALPDDLFLNPGLYLEIEVDLSGNAAFETNEKYAPRQHILSPFLRAYGDNICTGTLTVVGDLNWSAKTSYYFVMAPDCQELDETYAFVRATRFLYKASGFAGFQEWYAPVHLPNGATVTGVTSWWLDSRASEDVLVDLRRRALGPPGGSETLADVSSSGSAGEGSTDNTTISNAVIDNSAYYYYLYVYFPGVDTGAALRFNNARITYTTTGP